MIDPTIEDLDALRRDALRYRFLRDGPQEALYIAPIYTFAPSSGPANISLVLASGSHLDEGVDAAMAKLAAQQ